MSGRNWTLMAILASLWGASYMFNEVALDDGVDPIFLVFVRAALGAVVLVPLAHRARAWTALRDHWPAAIAMGLVQVVAPFLLIAFGQERVNSSLTGIIVSSTPIFTALLAARSDQEERPRGVAGAGILVGIVGIVLLFGIDLSGDSRTIVGGVMIVSAALAYAIGGLFLKHRLGGLPALGVAASTMIVATVALAPAAALTVPGHVPAADASASLLVLGFGGTGAAFVIYYTLIGSVGPSRAALVTYIVPAFAVFYGVTLLDEALTAGAVVGLVLTLAGSWLAAEGRLPGRAL